MKDKLPASAVIYEAAREIFKNKNCYPPMRIHQATLQGFLCFFSNFCINLAEELAYTFKFDLVL